MSRRRRNIKMYGLTSFILTNILSVSTLLSSKNVLLNMYGSFPSLCIWTAGAFICCIFGLCYAELGASLEGGEFEYLSLAYNKKVGKLFIFASLLVVFPAYTGMFVNVIHDLIEDYSPYFFINMSICLLLLFIMYFTGKLFFINKILFVINNGIVIFFLLSALYTIFTLYDHKSSFEKNAFYDCRGQFTFKGISHAMLFSMWGYDGWSRGNSLGNKIYKPWYTLRYGIVYAIFLALVFVLLINISFLLVLPYDTIKAEENFTTTYFKHLGLHLNRVIINILPLYGSLLSSFVSSANQKIEGKILIYFSMSVLYSILDYKYKCALLITQSTQVFFYTLNCFGLILLRKREKVNRSYMNHISIPILGTMLGMILLVMFSTNII